MSSILNVVANVKGRVFVDQNDVSVQMILAWLFFNIDKIESDIYTIDRRKNNGLWSMVNSSDAMATEDIIVVSAKSDYSGMKNAVIFDSLLEITHDDVVLLEKAMELVANRICESLQRSPRRIYIIYVNDVCNDVLLERVPNLHHLDTINNLPRFGCKSSIYSNEQ